MMLCNNPNSIRKSSLQPVRIALVFLIAFTSGHIIGNNDLQKEKSSLSLKLLIDHGKKNWKVYAGTAVVVAGILGFAYWNCENAATPPLNKTEDDEKLFKRIEKMQQKNKKLFDQVDEKIKLEWNKPSKEQSEEAKEAFLKLLKKQSEFYYNFDKNRMKTLEEIEAENKD
jgi:leucyl aminopeptidase (aminopeptidase T)